MIELLSSISSSVDKERSTHLKELRGSSTVEYYYSIGITNSKERFVKTRVRLRVRVTQ